MAKLKKNTIFHLLHKPIFERKADFSKNSISSTFRTILFLEITSKTASEKPTKRLFCLWHFEKNGLFPQKFACEKAKKIGFFWNFCNFLANICHFILLKMTFSQIIYSKAEKLSKNFLEILILGQPRAI